MLESPDRISMARKASLKLFSMVFCDVGCIDCIQQPYGIIHVMGTHMRIHSSSPGLESLSACQRGGVGAKVVYLLFGLCSIMQLAVSARLFQTHPVTRLSTKAFVSYGFSFASRACCLEVP